MKNYLILSALLAFVPATAQTSLGDYRQAVTEYSWELKVAASKSDAASQTMGQARTGYLPRLSLDGSFTATVHHYDGVERWNFSVLPQLVQTVYGGGAVRAAYKQAELGYDIALCDEEFTQLDVRYAAEYTYWNLSAMALYAASIIPSRCTISTSCAARIPTLRWNLLRASAIRCRSLCAYCPTRCWGAVRTIWLPGCAANRPTRVSGRRARRSIRR